MKIVITKKPLPENSLWRKKNLSLAAICLSLSMATQLMVLTSQFPTYALFLAFAFSGATWVFIVKSLKAKEWMLGRRE